MFRIKNEVSRKWNQEHLDEFRYLYNKYKDTCADLPIIDHWKKCIEELEEWFSEFEAKDE